MTSTFRAEPMEIKFQRLLSLIVKYDTGAQSYTRKSLMKFDLEHVPGDAEHIYLSYELTGMPSADFELLHIYRVENDWEERQ